MKQINAIIFSQTILIVGANTWRNAGMVLKKRDETHLSLFVRLCERSVIHIVRFCQFTGIAWINLVDILVPADGAFVYKEERGNTQVSG